MDPHSSLLDWIPHFGPRIKYVKEGRGWGWILTELVVAAITFFCLVAAVVSATYTFLADLAPAPQSLLSDCFRSLIFGAVVGYWTNVLAIIFMFRPYTEKKWLKLLRPLGFPSQGVVPANQVQLAQEVGLGIEEKLLKPEALAEDLTKLIPELLGDPATRADLNGALARGFRSQVPALKEWLEPMILDQGRRASDAFLQPSSVDRLFSDVIEPLLARPQTRTKIIDGVLGIARRVLPEIVEFLRDVVERYRDSGFWKRIAVGFAEMTGALDWSALAEVMETELASAKTRESIRLHLKRAVETIRVDLARQGEEQPELVREVLLRFRGFVSSGIDPMLKAFLNDMADNLGRGDQMVKWLEPLLPSMVESELPAILRKKPVQDRLVAGFQVARRVEEAIKGMKVEDLQKMVDDVAIRQFSALAVLGAALGAVSGLVFALLF